MSIRLNVPPVLSRNCLFVTLAIAASLGSTADAQEPSELWDAAQRGDTAEIRSLLDAGVDPNAPTQYNATALMYACGRGHEEAVKMLLKAGANPNNKDRFYNATPMAWAAMKQNKDIAVLLVEAGCEDILPALRLAMLADDTEATKRILNSDSAKPELLAQAMRFLPNSASEELRSLFDGVEAPATPEASNAAKPAWDPKPIELDLYVGEYQQKQIDSDSKSSPPKPSEDSRLTVSLADEKLTANFDGSSIVLSPTERHVFQLGGRTLRFEIESGLVSSLTLDAVEGGKDQSWFPVSTMILDAELRAESLAEDLAVSSADWGQFRGPQARGVADGFSLLKEWDLERGVGIRWRIDVPGLAHSSPIVVGDRIYLTSAISSGDTAGLKTGLYGDVDSVDDDSEHEFVLLCFDKKTGDELWRRSAITARPQVKRHLKSTHANPTPACDGQHVVAFFGSEGLFCYSVDGTLLWQKQFGLLDSGWFFDASYQWGFAASPIIFDGKVIIQCDIQEGSFVTALDIETGDQIWRRERNEIPSWATPTVIETSEGPQLVCNATKHAIAYSPENGSELWRIGNNSEIAVPTPFGARGLIYVASGYRPIKPIYAILPTATGDLTLDDKQRASKNVAWSVPNSGPYMTTPVVYDNYLYTCNSAGILECFDARNGKRKFRKRIGSSDARSFVAALVAGDGHVYVPSEEGRVIVLKAGNEFEKVAENDLGESLLASPAISEGVLYFRTESKLIAIGEPAEK
ncbi:MAG: PQQ-binding-like beta-propeller repeat protein [Aureliella sp.]